MKRKIFLFNVILLVYLASFTASDGQSPSIPLPDGAIARFSPGASVYTVAFSPDGKFLASGGDDNAVILWDVTSNHKLKTFTEHTDWVKCVAFSPDGQILASASMDRSVKLRSVSSDSYLSNLKHSDWVESVMFSPNGKTLATSGNTDGSIELWDVSRKHAIRTDSINGHRSGISSIAFSPNGLLLASAGDDDTVRLWDVASRSEVKSITEHSSDVHSVVFSPDGKTLASGSKDNTIKLWEVSSGDVLATLEHDYVESVAISPDGKTLASASADYTVKLWSTSSQSEIVSLNGHRNGVTSVVFSPDGKTLASGSRDGTILVWDLPYFNIESTSPTVNLPEKPDTLEVEEPENPSVADSSEETKPSVSKSDSPSPLSDTTPPTISIDMSTTGVMRVATSQFTVQGSVIDDNGVDEVKVNDIIATVLEDGVFTATVQLSNGENPVRVTATDISGNMGTNQFTIVHESKSKSLSPHSDTTPPIISIDVPATSRVSVAVNQFTVHGRVTDDNSFNEVRVNNKGVEISEDGVFAATVQLTYGGNPVRVMATDTSGNMDTHQFTIFRDETADTTGPDIRILYPVANVTRGIQAKIHLTEAFTRVSGIVTDPNGVAEVKVNGTTAQITGNDFNTTVQLAYGDNLIQVTASDAWGNQSGEEITIFREKYDRKGKDYALLFAVDSYAHWEDLRKPLSDAETIQQDLQSIYGFEVELIQNPTRERILEALLRYAEKQYTKKDQLLIFFAGHGHFNPGFKEGYLVAQDTQTPDNDITMGSYLSHSEFRNIVDRMSCNHIFLVLDTCYSGTFDERLAMRGEGENVPKSFSTADIERKLTYKTRWYLTSGGKEQVPDESLFARTLLEALRGKGGSDNILTIKEILTYFEDLSNPKPRASGFGSDEPGSDFLLFAK